MTVVGLKWMPLLEKLPVFIKHMTYPEINLKATDSVRIERIGGERADVRWIRPILALHQ